MKYLLILLLIFPCAVFAAAKPGAKPTIWEIVEATPKKTNVLDDVVDATNLNDVVEATGRKLDYDRTPVDNKVYKTRVNPRIPETKAAIGNNAMKKLLKVSGWGFVAVEGVKALLEGIDWVMDPANQSIWRYKSTEPTPGCNGGEFLWRYQQSEFRKCPIDAVTDQIRKWTDSGIAGYEFVKWDVPNVLAAARAGERITFTVKRTVNGQTNVYPNQVLEYRKDPDYKPPTEKEILTEEALADYMLGTHKDFKDDKYKSKLPKENTWTGVAQQFKPENKFEEQNSPTVKIAQDQLDQANPESEDTTVKPTEPDPITGEKGFSLPSFCSWATTVCDFIKWFKEDPEQEDTELDLEDSELPKIDSELKFNGQCPADRVAQIPFILRTIEMKFSYQPICQVVSDAKPVLIFVGFFIAALIVGGIKQ